MRLKPSALIAVVLAVAYTAIISVIWLVQGTDYKTVGDTTDNLIRGVLIPVGIGALFLAGAATWLGWWRPSLVDDTGLGERWMLLAPLFMLLAGVGNLLTGEVGSKELTYLVVLGIGVLLVGFSEEMLTRGLGLVGLRGSMPEIGAWFFSCLIFGLIHSVNVLFGQDLGTTGVQIVFAFLSGSVLYVTRMGSGLLVVAMLLHAFWDFTTLSHGAAQSTSLIGLLGFGQYIAWVIAGIAVLRIWMRSRANRSDPTPVTT